jgi:IS5 family transposase
MRQKRTVQSSIFDVYAEHDIGRELKAMSDGLDAHSEILEWVAEDLCRPAAKHTGRIGMSAESILRCAILKQYRQLRDEELAFFLEDSLSLQAFARLPLSVRPKKSALQAGISAIRDESWERINQRLLKVARQAKIETGRRVRVDSTVTQTPILIPADSHLLWDSVRIQARLLEQAQALVSGVRLDWHDRYCPSPVSGQHWYLYLIIDIYSRKIVA